MRYRDHLSAALAKRFDGFFLSSTHAQQLQLYDEIALSRTFLTEQLELYKCLSTAEAEKAGTVQPELLIAAMGQVKDGISHVGDLCAKMARMEMDLADTVSSRQLVAFVGSVVDTLERTLGADNPLVKQIADDLATKTHLTDETVIVVDGDEL